MVQAAVKFHDIKTDYPVFLRQLFEKMVCFRPAETARFRRSHGRDFSRVKEVQVYGKVNRFCQVG